MSQPRSITLDTDGIRPATPLVPAGEQPFTALSSLVLLSQDFRLLAASPGTAAWLGLPPSGAGLESLLTPVITAARDRAGGVTDRGQRFLAELSNGERNTVVVCLHRLDGPGPHWLLTLESPAAARLVGDVIRDATFTEVTRRLRPKVIHDLKGPAQTLLVGTRIVQKALSLQPDARPPVDPQQALGMMEDAVRTLIRVAEASLPEPHGAMPAAERLDAITELREAVRACEPIALPRGVDLQVRADPAALHVHTTRAQLHLTLRLFLLTTIDLLLEPGASEVRAGRAGERLRVTVAQALRSGAAAAAGRESGTAPDPALALMREKTREGLGLHVLQTLAREQGGRCELSSTGLVLELPAIA